ncbi:MotA/TolQ/ExbB proton channel family protein [Sphingomonas sp.]|uniref:motility protein A n=1 Tax=Sphingomonas sp. TaxID=28214 RepID=UPI001D9FACEE|nr:MotA/TolQ/ExbB proton channel family protein [Sphingomonas sp.]MBX9795370.1 MotA/TolQ/ExbB proton channel family protein [Sphingomonas sp.]
MTRIDTISSLAPFVDPAALGIVAGGTVAAVILRTPARDLARAIGALRVLVRHNFRADPLIEQVGAFGRIAARHGVLSLDRSVIADPDVAAAVAAIVDGGDAAAVTRVLNEARLARTERHLAAADMWAGAADIAPAMGMVGTLIGLAEMFRSMTDPSAIGGAMAVALLSTLYGALIANLVALPIAGRLRRAARVEAFERLRIEAPLRALAVREAPRRRLGAAA